MRTGNCEVSHSQTVMIRHPSRRNFTLFVRSRWTLESILFRQKSLRVLG
jgi:hypothetical protein